MQNYYQVLGVDRDAEIKVIRKAYRKAATKSHPDMGGTHAKMTLINEAYAVLSDQTLRAEYDRVFFGSRDEQARADWEESAEEVREAASEYPQHWEEFEDWMRGFTKDVAAAKYGSKQVFGPIVIPTVDGSVSAIIAMVIGGFSGFILLGICTGLYGYLLRRILDPQPDDMVLGRVLWTALLAGPVLIGLWAGQFFHKMIQRMTNESKKVEEGSNLRAATKTEHFKMSYLIAGVIGLVISVFLVDWFVIQAIDRGSESVPPQEFIDHFGDPVRAQEAWEIHYDEQYDTLFERMTFFWVMYLPGAAIGALAGYTLARIYQQPPKLQSKGEDKDKKVVVPCPECGRKLKVPPIERTLVVTCKNCRHKFDHTPLHLSEKKSNA